MTLCRNQTFLIDLEIKINSMSLEGLDNEENLLDL